MGFGSLSRTSPHLSGSPPGHVIGQVGREELDHLGAILDCPEPSYSDQLRPITVALTAPRNNRLHDPPGRDDAWGDAVGGDPDRPEILRQIPRIMSDSGFRRTIMGVAAIGGRCSIGDRTNRDDLPQRRAFLFSLASSKEFSGSLHAEFTANLLHINRSRFVGKARISGNDEEPANA